MIEAIRKFANGYRAVGIEKTRGMEGLGWAATILKDGVMIGTAADYADGGPVSIDIKGIEVSNLLVYAKSLYPDSFEHDGQFLEDLVNYEISIKDLKSKSKKVLMKCEYENKDANGVPTSYSIFKCADTTDNRQKILEKEPATIFLNEQLNSWEAIRKPK